MALLYRSELALSAENMALILGPQARRLLSQMGHNIANRTVEISSIGIVRLALAREAIAA
ncbi:MAG: hypothetical protein Hens2KO_30270 [Henriciella sp.]